MIITLLQDVIHTANTDVISEALKLGLGGILLLAIGWYLKKFFANQHKRDEENRIAQQKLDQANRDLMVQILEEYKEESEKTQSRFNDYLQNENKQLRQIVSEFTEMQAKTVEALNESSRAFDKLEETINKFSNK